MQFEKIYQEKKKSAAEVAALIPDASEIYSDIFLAQPKTIYEAINNRCLADTMRSCKITTYLDLYPLVCYTEPIRFAKNLQGISVFCSALTRKSVGQGLADYLPNTYWDQPALIREYKNVDVFVISVSPMDSHGYFSLGVTGSDSAEYLKKAKMVLVEVNQQMPYCSEAPRIHVSDVTALCEADYALPVLPPAKLDDVSITIGNLIAEHIPDGACLQLGIGSIPDAVGMALKSKRHLGIHTEMLTDSMIELIECGAVDNSCKQVYQGKTLATFAYGSKRMYDYIDHNPSVAILPVDYVNNPYVVSQNNNFVSVNAALEVDLSGQVCAESIGNKMFSGSGGQLDYVRGAMMSRGGMSFIAFPSTAKGGTISKIKPFLTPGAGVTTGRNEVDMIVTEYGIAKLRGRTFGERAKALISIAHPNFREKLTFEAQKMGLMM